MDELKSGEISLDAATVETPLNSIVETTEGTQLSELLKEEPKETPKSEPGWVKKRIDSALQKEMPQRIAEVETRLRAEYEAKIKPLLDAQLERDAADLVKEGEFKSKERALEYLRLKGGLPVEKKESPKEEPIPEHIVARADALLAQAEYARKMDGIDPMEIYKTSPEIADKVNSGEWDFADVVKAMKGKTPSPIYSSNAASPQKRGILDLTPEEFKKLNENLAKGNKVRP